MTRDEIRRIINFALGKWQAVANINFREVSSDNADILVSFAPGSHGDPYPFDGRGGTLAHAYYPYPNFGRYFDDIDLHALLENEVILNLLFALQLLE